MMLVRLCLAALLSGFATPVLACKIALVLGIDVSHSIDNFEYRLQIEGTADALRDPVIRDILIESQAAVAVVQWSGAAQQQVSVPWIRITSHRALGLLEQRIRSILRPWDDSNTGVGAALSQMTALFQTVPDCARKIIDFSGDGISNSGPLPIGPRVEAQKRGIVINGLAIDRVGRSVTEYFKGHVIAGSGAFVVTATGFRDYPRAIRMKLLRELLPPAS